MGPHFCTRLLKIRIIVFDCEPAGMIHKAETPHGSGQIQTQIAFPVLHPHGCPGKYYRQITVYIRIDVKAHATRGKILGTPTYLL